MLSPTLPLWHIGYFELKALEKQLRQEGLSALPVYLNEGHTFPVRKVASLYQEVENMVITGDGEPTLR